LKSKAKGKSEKLPDFMFDFCEKCSYHQTIDAKFHCALEDVRCYAANVRKLVMELGLLGHSKVDKSYSHWCNSWMPGIENNDTGDWMNNQ